MDAQLRINLTEHYRYIKKWLSLTSYITVVKTNAAKLLKLHFWCTSTAAVCLYRITVKTFDLSIKCGLCHLATFKACLKLTRLLTHKLMVQPAAEARPTSWLPVMLLDGSITHLTSASSNQFYLQCRSVKHPTTPRSHKSCAWHHRYTK